MTRIVLYCKRENTEKFLMLINILINRTLLHRCSNDYFYVCIDFDKHSIHYRHKGDCQSYAIRQCEVPTLSYTRLLMLYLMYVKELESKKRKKGRSWWNQIRFKTRSLLRSTITTT